MDVLFDLFTLDLVRSGVRLGTPIILAAIGGALCNRAGVLNLALEGKMLMGAFLGILAAYFLKSSYLGVIMAALSGGILGAVFAFLYLRYEVDLVILAIAINLFIAEMTVFFMRTFLGDVGTWSDPSIEQLPDLALPLIHNVPVLGRLFSGYNAIVYLSWLAAVVIYFILFYTKFGRHVRAVDRPPGGGRRPDRSAPRTSRRRAPPGTPDAGDRAPHGAVRDHEDLSLAVAGRRPGLAGLEDQLAGLDVLGVVGDLAAGLELLARVEEHVAAAVVGAQHVDQNVQQHLRVAGDYRQAVVARLHLQRHLLHQ